MVSLTVLVIDSVFLFLLPEGGFAHPQSALPCDGRYLATGAASTSVALKTGTDSYYRRQTRECSI